MEPMAGAFHCAEDLSSGEVDLHYAPRKRVVSNVLDVVAMWDDHNLVFGGREVDVVAMCDDPHLVLGCDEDDLCRPEMFPLLDELAVAVEDLDAVVFAVADIDETFRIDGNGVRRVELPRTCTSFAPTYRYWHSQ